MRTVSTTGCWLGTGAIFIGDSLHEFPRTLLRRSSALSRSYTTGVQRGTGPGCACSVQTNVCARVDILLVIAGGCLIRRGEQNQVFQLQEGPLKIMR
jgi:hypothetical protein